MACCGKYSCARFSFCVGAGKDGVCFWHRHAGLDWVETAYRSSTRDTLPILYIEYIETSLLIDRIRTSVMMYQTGQQNKRGDYNLDAHDSVLDTRRCPASINIPSIDKTSQGTSQVPSARNNTKLQTADAEGSTLGPNPVDYHHPLLRLCISESYKTSHSSFLHSTTFPAPPVMGGLSISPRTRGAH